MAFAPSPYQTAVFDWISNGRGSVVIRAVAGSGKTTTIMEAQSMIPDTCSVQLFAFNKSIADELTARLNKTRERLARSMPKFAAGTFHSVCFGAVRKHLSTIGVSKPIVDAGKMRKLARDFLTPANFEIYGDYAIKLAGLAKGEGIGVLTPDTCDAWQALVDHHDITLDTTGADDATAIAFSRDLFRDSERVAKSGNLDFDDMLFLVVKWNLKLWQNDWVFVDEAQDTNPVRRAIVRLALKASGRLVAVGDPGQAIYGFTGASHDAIDLIKRDFKAIELPLTVSYRCAKSIIELAQTIVPDIQSAPDAIDGLVVSLTLDATIPILTAHDAILCRQTAPLVSLAYRLLGQGIGCRVLGKDIGVGLIRLIKQQKTRTVADLLVKLEKYRAREIEKYTTKDDLVKIDAVNDRVDSVVIIADSLGDDPTIDGLIAAIESLFKDTNGVLTLATVHKAKGAEWERVAILRPELMPSKRARQDWQIQQETNLQYVAWTRAMKHLIFIQTENK